MILLNRPSGQKVEDYLSGLKKQQFSYSTTGMTKDSDTAPSGYITDHHRVRLGEGADVFHQSVKALNHWQHFNLGWLNVSSSKTPIEPGSTIGLICTVSFVWLLFACRIVYIFNETDSVQKYGFAYGTLPGHPECGEERFTIEWRHADNSVWYDLLAFSRPGSFLVALGFPLTRMVQKRFGHDSQLAMLKAVSDQESTSAW